MTLLDTIEKYWFFISFLILNLGGLIIAFNKVQQTTAEHSRRLDKLEMDIEKLQEKVTNNDISLATIGVRLVNIETMLTEIKVFLSRSSTLTK